MANVPEDAIAVDLRAGLVKSCGEQRCLREESPSERDRHDESGEDAGAFVPNGSACLCRIGPHEVCDHIERGGVSEGGRCAASFKDGPADQASRRPVAECHQPFQRHVEVSGIGKALRGQVGGGAVDDVDELILRAQVVVDQSEVHTGVVGDLAQCDRRSTLGDQLPRGGQQRLHHLLAPTWSRFRHLRIVRTVARGLAASTLST